MNSGTEGHAGVGEDAIAAALEQVPEIRIPEDFAARVARGAVAQGLPARSPRHGFGVGAALVSTVLLLLVMFLYAPGGARGSLDLRFGVELLLLAELGGVAFVAARGALGD